MSDDHDIYKQKLLLRRVERRRATSSKPYSRTLAVRMAEGGSRCRVRYEMCMTLSEGDRGGEAALPYDDPMK